MDTKTLLVGQHGTLNSKTLKMTDCCPPLDNLNHFNQITVRKLAIKKIVMKIKFKNIRKPDRKNKVFEMQSDKHGYSGQYMLEVNAEHALCVLHCFAWNEI